MKIAGALPKGEANGLATLDRIVTSDTEMRHVVIAVLATKKVVTDIETNETEAQMRIERIERILPLDVEVAEQLLRRALQKRSGQTVLPIDVEDDISSAFREALLDIHGDDPTTSAKDDRPTSDGDN